MKESPRQSFRWGAHTAGVAAAKPRDYEEGVVIEAPHAYGAWAALRQSDQPLDVGDILEDEVGTLRIFKYVGFEEARWVLPEVRTGLESAPPAAGQPPAKTVSAPGLV